MYRFHNCPMALLWLSLTMLTHAAQANEPAKAAPGSPEKVVEDIVKDGKRAADGTIQPSTGRAEPVENWFGCKPGSDKSGADGKASCGKRSNDVD